jgi:peroxiredoxin
MPTVEPPKTEEGLFVSHLMLTLPPEQRRTTDNETITKDAESFFNNDETFQSNERAELVRITSGEADFMTLLFAETLDELEAFQTDFLGSSFGSRLQRVDSFLSVTELSMYKPLEERVESSLQKEGIEPDDEEYDKAYEERKKRLEKYQKMRLTPDLPDMKYVTFYPMEKRRQPKQNWYQLPKEQRAKMMSSHGKIGRQYAGKVQQIITSCVGLDDWEWGVTLYADDPKQFKRLIYEMRFDEVSAEYSDFGPFYTGFKIDPDVIGEHLPV